MKANGGTRRSVRAPMLLAAAAGLALSASGCIIDSSSNNNGCLPDLTVSWRIVSAIDGAILSCYEAGNADTVTAVIDGGGLGTNLTEFTGPCPASSTQGSFVAQLPTTGSYNVSLELTAGATLLSETTVLIQPVDCSGLSATPRADMLVNF
jgi:hypothetical protein